MWYLKLQYLIPLAFCLSSLQHRPHGSQPGGLSKGNFLCYLVPKVPSDWGENAGSPHNLNQQVAKSSSDCFLLWVSKGHYLLQGLSPPRLRTCNTNMLKPWRSDDWTSRSAQSWAECFCKISVSWFFSSHSSMKKLPLNFWGTVMSVPSTSLKKKITERDLAMGIVLKLISCSPALQQLRVTGVGTQKHSYF